MEKALQKRKPLSEETKEKLRRIFTGRKLTSEWKHKIGLANIGRKYSKETIKKISIARKGQRLSEETKFKIAKALTGIKNPLWKGDKVGYHALHDWVIRYLGQPDTCEHCGKTGLSRLQIHWANKSGEYKRELSDWLRLCAKCHKKYDLKFNNIQ